MIAHTFGTALFRHIWDPDLSEETKFSKDKEGPMLAGLQAAFADAVSCASQQVEGAITSSTDECIIGRYYVGGNKDGQNLGIRARPYVPSLSGYMRNPYAARQEQSKPSALHRIDSTFNIPRLTKERVNGLFGSVFYSFLANNIPVNEIARGVMLYHASYKALLKSSPSRTERNTPHDFQHIRDCLMRHFANSDADFFYAAAYVFQQHGMGKRLSTRSRVSSGGEVKYEEREKVYSLCY